MDNGLYYHDADLANGAGDNSYRYAGANPDNYVCFGDDCNDEDNLYRIIGVFGNEVKLIKNISIGNYYWSGLSSNQSNTWSDSTLNTGTLNGTYLAGLDNNSWSSMITTYTWKVGGAAWTNVFDETPQTVYNYELGANSSSTTYNAKIGLMYISDYGFAASSDYWATPLNKYDEGAKDYDWMYLGSNEWTISRYLNNSNRAFLVRSGFIGYDGVYIGLIDVRPVFYLSSFVQYFGGEGTLENPIRLSNNEIQFTIEGIQYTALEGMEWGDWINSEYNTSEYQQHCTNDYISVGCSGITGVIDNTNNTSVTITDKIYSREYSHGGMHDPCSCITLPEM